MTVEVHERAANPPVVEMPHQVGDLEGHRRVFAEHVRDVGFEEHHLHA